MQKAVFMWYHYSTRVAPDKYRKIGLRLNFLFDATASSVGLCSV